MIGPKTTATTRKGQVFNLNVGLSNLVNKDAKEKEGKVYALFVGDTVCVNEVRNHFSNFFFIFSLCTDMKIFTRKKTKLLTSWKIFISTDCVNSQCE